MKGLIFVALLAVLGFSVYNWMQIRSLQEEIARLDAKVQQQQQAGGGTHAIMLQARIALEQAKAALNSSNVQEARAAFSSAQQKLAEAARTAGDKAAPGIQWLQEQAAAVGREVDRKVHGR